MLNHSPFDSKKIRKLLLISIAGNIIFLLTYEILAVTIGTGAFGILIFLISLSALNILSLIIDIRTYLKLKNPDPLKIISSIQYTSILEIGTAATGNIISLITGVLILTNLEKFSETLKN